MATTETIPVDSIFYSFNYSSRPDGWFCSISQEKK